MKGTFSDVNLGHPRENYPRENPITEEHKKKPIIEDSR